MRTITINGVRYDVVRQLSLPSRGRWVIRVPRPAPKGTNYTLIDVQKSDQSEQLLDVVSKLPQNQISIPGLIDFDRFQNRIRMVLTWRHGIDFEEYFRRIDSGRYKPIGATIAVRQARTLAHSIAVLHRDYRIIHGDIKPANIVLPNERVPPFLIDFGNGWQVENSRYRIEGDGCDPIYSAPELFLPRPLVTTKADQFSIGILLYRMLTGRLPYDDLGGKAGHLEYREYFTEPVESIRESPIADQKVPEAVLDSLDALLRKCLALDPTGRFPTTREFASNLDRILGNIQSKTISLNEARAKIDRVQSSWLSKLISKFVSRDDP